MGIGVEVTTSLRTGPSNTGTVSGRFLIGGLTEFGPVASTVMVRSIAGFEAVFGARTPYASNVYDSARTFFEEGGSELVVARAVGPAATKGFVNLKDGSDVETVKIESVTPGAHSSALSVEVTAQSGTFTVSVRRNDELVGLFRNLQTVADLVDVAARNTFVNAIDLGSITAAPGNVPAVIERTPLTAGSDDRASVTAATVVSAMANPGASIRGGAVAAPGYPAETIGQLLIDFADTTNTIALLASGEGAGADEAKLNAAALIRRAGASAGLFYPHIVIPDGSGTRVLSPESYVAAVRARAHLNVGFWKVPAGEMSLPNWIIGTAVPVDRLTNNDLNEAQVNGITTIGGKPRLYGWASLCDDLENLGLLSAKDTLNNLGLQVENVLEEFVYAVNDGRGHLRSKVESAITGILDPIARLDGFYPLERNDEEVDPGYSVVVDEALNTAASISNNELRASISVRLSPTAALIRVEIIKVALTAAA